MAIPLKEEQKMFGKDRKHEPAKWFVEFMQESDELERLIGEIEQEIEQESKHE